MPVAAAVTLAACGPASAASAASSDGAVHRVGSVDKTAPDTDTDTDTDTEAAELSGTDVPVSTEPPSKVPRI